MFQIRGTVAPPCWLTTACSPGPHLGLHQFSGLLCSITHPGPDLSALVRAGALPPQVAQDQLKVVSEAPATGRLPLCSGDQAGGSGQDAPCPHSCASPVSSPQCPTSSPLLSLSRCPRCTHLRNGRNQRELPETSSAWPCLWPLLPVVCQPACHHSEPALPLPKARRPVGMCIQSDLCSSARRLCPREPPLPFPQHFLIFYWIFPTNIQKCYVSHLKRKQKLLTPLPLLSATPFLGAKFKSCLYLLFSLPLPPCALHTSQAPVPLLCGHCSGQGHHGLRVAKPGRQFCILTVLDLLAAVDPALLSLPRCALFSGRQDLQDSRVSFPLPWRLPVRKSCWFALFSLSLLKLDGSRAQSLIPFSFLSLLRPLVIHPVPWL